MEGVQSCKPGVSGSAGLASVGSQHGSPEARACPFLRAVPFDIRAVPFDIRMVPFDIRAVPFDIRMVP